MDRDRFSASVRRVADSFSKPVTAGGFAGALTGLPLPDGGDDRLASEWLERCEPLLVAETGLDEAAVAVALGRLEPPVGRALRGDEAPLHEWAKRPRVTGYAELTRLEGDHNTCAISPDGRRIAYGGDDGQLHIRVLDTEDEEVVNYRDAVVDCAYGPGGALAVALADGSIRLHGTEIVMRHEGVRSLAFVGEAIVAASSDGTVRSLTQQTSIVLLSAEQGEGMRRHAAAGDLMAFPIDAGVLLYDDEATVLPSGPVATCAIGASGRHVAAATQDGALLLWDLTRPDLPYTAASRGVRGCGFSDDGRVVLAADEDGVRGFDVVSGAPLGTSDGAALGTVWRCATGPNGMVAVASDSGTAVYEPVAGHMTLAEVAPDSLGGTDLLGVAADAAALADVISAKTTSPPLSIGLFADWGSGKSFLIKLIQERVRILSRRASGNPDAAAHCAHVRNVEFNAWHFADANLWASLASHILDAMAKPEAGTDARTAAARLAKLEELLAAESATGRQLERAHRKAVRAQTLRRLGFLALGRDSEKTLGELKDAWTWLRILLGVIVPIGVLAAVLIGLVGLDAAKTSVTAALAAAATFGVTAKRVADALGSFSPTSVETVKNAKAEVEAAKAREAGLREEYDDLAHGRALARYAAKRGGSGDYRSQLGLISRIHEDFERMSDLLTGQRGARGGDKDLPQIDRIVLYIDDLDRCSPKRVVEVLEAVHLILALPLFVVVIAVDPRWLLQSLKLHYAELLKAQDEPHWQSTPLNYLEKIIQIPFTLRPMGPAGTTALVSSLLPVYVPVTDSPAETATPATPSAPVTLAPAPATGTPTPRTPAPALLNPRQLVLTERERDFAALVARELHTPRAVKKLTNIYRLVRARLEEDAEAFIATRGADMPEFQAVLILLTVLIAYPDEASGLLLKLDEQQGAWSSRQIGGELGAFLDRATEQAINGATTSTEPFRRHALELARYSFAAGQEVYAKR
ncbi:KAP-like P-loop domain-containing protein [Solirubrobacter pauli]|uniref:KAP-like P-loop domain-containing protein n=1 Tax=Solirubrobacter pauli TaxID=166793 RepID=A0A660LEF8_9ACTN|nr:P-loop NTPase fold protein [Solirubrobacter pauli]RKQ92696.1 KAP-like P-loop domain-containing protein [Solirubrobacter pauli]